MIRRYNIGQAFAAAGNIALSLIGYVAAYAFFYFGVNFAGDSLLRDYDPNWGHAAAAGALIALTIGGVLRARRGDGHYGYEGAGVYHDLDPVSGGAVAVDYYAHRVTAPAYVLSQLFLAGPLRFMRALQNLRNRIAPEHGLEGRLTSLLHDIRAREKWHDVRDYDERRREVAILVRMDKVEFSARKGRIKG